MEFDSHAQFTIPNRIIVCFLLIQILHLLNLFLDNRMFDLFLYPDRYKIEIRYETSPSASALQWLEPEQTAGGEHPYLFSQCQVRTIQQKETFVLR